MRSKLFLVLIALFILAVPTFAQEGGAPATGGSINAPLFAIGMAIAAGLCGLGQGKAIGSAVEGMARNPAASGTIQTAMLIGLAFIESLALFTLVLALRG